jgi:hypothetical protein
MLALVDRPSLNRPYFVGGLCLQFGKDVLRLRLRSKRHLDWLVVMLRVGRIGGRGQVAVGIILAIPNACLSVPAARESARA